MSTDISAAISSAVAEAKAEASASPEPAETTETTAPATESKPEPATEDSPAPEKPAAEKKAEAAKPAEEEDDDFWKPTAEELALIDKSPELKKVYRSMQRGLTKKAQSLSELRKSVEDKARIADWIQNDPEKAARALAEATGLTLAEAREATKSEAKAVDALEEKWTKVVGKDAAALLRPLFEETARNLFEQVVGPIREEAARLSRASAERGIAASVREFGASITERGEDWDDEIQADMARLSEVVRPGDNTDIQTYLGTLYDTAMTRRLRTRSTKANLERLRRVRTEAEPNTSARPTPKPDERITADMSDNDAIAMAVRQARASMGQR